MAKFFKKLVDNAGGKKVSILDMLALGIGDFGYSIVSCTVATYIVSFGTMALPGVGTGLKLIDFSVLMAIAVGIAVVCDAISDPIMGYISDNFHSKKFGKRHLFMLIGLIGMMGTALAVWYVPYQNMGAIGTFVWFAVFLILIRTFNTMYYTPVGALSVEISNDYNERTTIQAVRSVFYIIGMLLPVVLMGSFQNRYAGTYEIGYLGSKLFNPFTLQPIEHFKRIEEYAACHNAELVAFAQTNPSAYWDSVNNTFNSACVTDYLTSIGLEFRKGQMIAAGYQVFAIVGTAICIVCTAFIMGITNKYIAVMRKREEEEAERSGKTIIEEKRKITREECKRELVAEGVENPKKREINKRLRVNREKAGQITMGAVFRNFFDTFKVKEMRIISIGYVVAMMSATLIINLGFNVFTFTFDLTNTQMYVLMGALLLCTIASQLVWGKLAKKKSKEFSMFTGLIISFVGCVLLFVEFLLRKQINTLLAGDLAVLGVVLLAPPLMIAGFGTGVLYSMPLALVGDVVVIQKALTGEDKTGTYAGVMTFCYKAGQGIVTTVSTSLLSAIGFVSGAATQTEKASSGIGWILCVGVIVFVGAGILIFSRLKLDKKKIEETLARQNNTVSAPSEE